MHTLPRTWALHLAAMALFALGIADALTTWAAIHYGGAEANPVGRLQLAQMGMAGTAGIRIVVTVLFIAALGFLAQPPLHFPRLAAVLGWGIAAFWTFVVVNNLVVVGRLVAR